MISAADRLMHRGWIRRGEAMSLRELEIAAAALGELHAMYSLQGKYPQASFSFELHEEGEAAE